jgi:hypothetical protein
MKTELTIEQIASFWGRIGALLCNTEHFMAVCRANHQILHARPSRAREKGFIL